MPAKIPKEPLATLLILPTILIVIGAAFLYQLFPIYAGPSGLNSDPAYVYLTNGLSLLEGKTPSHTDHPGTPLQILSALIVFMQWLFSRLVNGSSEDIISAALLHPEQYMFTICCVLLTLNAWAVFYFGRRIFQAVNNIRWAIFCQTAPLAFWAVSPRIAYLSPEALLIFASICLLGLLAPVMLGKDDESKNISALAGIVCGFGIAVKLTFIPVIGLLLLLDTRNALIRALKYSTVTLAIFLLPVVAKVPRMLDWIYSLAVHSERYGSGQANFIAVDAMSNRMADLFRVYPFFYVVVILILAVLVLRTTAKIVCKNYRYPVATRIRYISKFIDAMAGIKEGSMKVPLVLLVVCILQTLLVIKHPGAHYMTPVLPIAFVALISLMRPHGTTSLSPSSVKWLPTVFLGLGIIMAANATIIAYDELKSNRLLQRNSLSSIQAELEKHTNPLVLGAYRCTLPNCAISFGIDYAHNLDKNVIPILSNFHPYNIWNKKLYVYGEGWVQLNRITKYLSEGREIYLVSPTWPQLDALILEPIINTPIQNLYQVKGLTDSKS